MRSPVTHEEPPAEVSARALALAVAVVVAALGVAALVSPERVIAVGHRLVSLPGLWAASAFRVAAGLVLMRAARASRAPGLLLAIGGAVLGSGVATPFFGVAAARARLDWEAAHLTFFRCEGAAFVCLGALVASVLRRVPPSGAGRPATAVAFRAE